MKRSLYYLIPFFIALLLIEIIFRLLIIFVPTQPLITNVFGLSPIMKDRVLKYRPNQAYFGHDHKGWRNREVPTKVDIVVMGDSQTYGSGFREEAWPQQLEEVTKLKTYNMAYGGYGPVHYWLLLNEAIELKPNIVMVAFYSGNDLYDSFEMAYYINNFSYLQTQNPQAISAIREAERVKSLDKIMLELSNFRTPLARQNTSGTSLPRQFKEILYNNLTIFKFLYNTKQIVINKMRGGRSWEDYKVDALRHSADLLVYEDDNFKTIFQVKSRSAALNLDDPRIYEGLSIALKSFHLIKESLDKLGINFIILFIPTKELVFSDIVNNSSIDKEDKYKINLLIENEKKMWTITKNELKKQGIPYVDALQCLQAKLAQRIQPYPISDDGHPNQAGYRAIAECASNMIKNRPD